MTSLPYGVTETYQSSTASKTLGFGWRGVYSTYAIYGQTEPLKALTPLKAEFNLPNNMLFRFLQLRHATQAQFSQPPLQSSPNPLIAITKDTDPKKLISCFYTMLTTPVATKITHSLKLRWERDLGNLEDEEWEEALDTCKEVSPKLSDRLKQLYIIHRAYLTPLRVARYKHNYSALCPMCKSI